MLTRNIKFKLFQTKPFLIVLGMAFLIFSGVFLFSSTVKAVDCSTACQHQTPPQCPDICIEDSGTIYWCDCYQYLTSCDGKIQETCGGCEGCKDDSGCYNACDEKDGWYDVGSSYPCCDSATGESCACQKQEARDYYCDNGSCAYNVVNDRTVYSNCSSCSDGDSCTADSCSDGVCSNTPYCTGTDSSCGCTSCTNCDEKDGWYDVDDSYPCCNSATGESCACQKQEKRDYYCDNGSCAYNVDDNRTVYSNCSSCSDGDSCTADSCSDGVCSNTPITTCTNGDGCCPSGCNHNNDNDCSNQPPSAPTDPTPSQNASDVSAPSLTLEWQGGDDPDGDSVTYYVYRCEGSGCTELNLLGNTTDKSWTVSDLEYSTTYRWQVVASDGDLEKKSSVWNFETGCTITQCGTTITKNGSSCVLGNDITCTGDGITITADNVTLDGQNHTIRGDGGSNDQGIYVQGDSITVRNFNIKFFYIGIELASNNNNNIISSNKINGCNYGIWLKSNNHNNNILSNTGGNQWYGIAVWIASPGSTGNYGCDNTISGVIRNCASCTENGNHINEWANADGSELCGGASVCGDNAQCSEGDGSSSDCSSCSGAKWGLTDGNSTSGCWENMCCGDDSNEYIRSRELFGYCSENDCTGFYSDSNDIACCNSSSDCVFDGTCYQGSEGDWSNISTWYNVDGENAVCHEGEWHDPDYSEDSCALGHWIKAGESDVGEYENYDLSEECCGDDDNEYYAELCPGVTGVDRKCCNSSGDKIDASGNCVSTCDTTPPDTIIDSGPSNPTNSTNASFTFHSTESDSTFECKVDSGSWSSCTSPKSYSGVAEGNHTFYVKATDSAGNTDPTPAEYSWLVDLTNPTISNLTATSPICSGSATSITWIGADPGANASGINRQELWRNINSAGWEGWCNNGSWQSDCSSYGGYKSVTSPQSVTLTTTGTTQFGIHIFDNAGNYLFSSAVDVVVDTSPSAPSNLNFSNVTDSQIRLHWNDNSNNEDGFYIYRDSDSNLIHTNNADDINWTNTGLSACTDYTYWISAYNNTCGESSKVSNTQSTDGCVGPDFDIHASPSSQTINSGESASYNVVLTAVNGFSDTVLLTTSGCPTAATCLLSPLSGTPNYNSTLTISNAPYSASAYTIIITGSGGGKTHSDSVQLTVNDGNDPVVDVLTVDGVDSDNDPVTNTDGSPLIYWEVSDTGGSGLDFVQVWRRDGVCGPSSGWKKVSEDIDQSGSSDSGTWTESLSDGTYCYGLHVSDVFGNDADESDNNKGPIEVIVSTGVDNFNLTNSGNISVQQGGSTQDVTIYVNSQNNFSQTVSLSDDCSSLGLSCSWPDGKSCAPPAGGQCSKVLRVGAGSASTGDKTVTVTGSSSGYSNQTTQFIVTVTSSDNLSPTADFSCCKVNDNTIRFSDESSDPDGKVAAWDWDFGDGSAHSYEQNPPDHTYSIITQALSETRVAGVQHKSTESTKALKRRSTEAQKQESTKSILKEFFENILNTIGSMADFMDKINSEIISLLKSDVSLAQTGWWNNDWAKRREITLTHSGSTLINYQVKINVIYDSDMQSDFGDLRFTNDSGTELDYWLESKTDGVSAVFWVEVPSIPDGGTSIYMYYDYQPGTLTTTSNGDNTFEYFENFESMNNGSINGQDGWVSPTDDNPGTVNIIDTDAYQGNKSAEVYNSTGEVSAERQLNLGSYKMIDAKLKLVDKGSSTGSPDFNFTIYDFEDDYIDVKYRRPVSDINWDVRYNDTHHDSGVSLNVGNWVDIEIGLRGNLMDVNIGGTSVYSGISQNADSFDKLHFYSDERARGRVDQIFVRQYILPEPSVFVAGEESQPTGNIFNVTLTVTDDGSPALQDSVTKTLDLDNMILDGSTIDPCSAANYNLDYVTQSGCQSMYGKWYELAGYSSIDDYNIYSCQGVQSDCDEADEYSLANVTKECGYSDANGDYCIFEETGLNENTTYWYYVSTTDGKNNSTEAGCVGGQFGTDDICPLSDTTPSCLSEVTGVVITRHCGYLTISWNDQYDSYKLLRCVDQSSAACSDPDFDNTVIYEGANATYDDSEIIPVNIVNPPDANYYCYAVVGYDAAGQATATSTPVCDYSYCYRAPAWQER